MTRRTRWIPPLPKTPSIVSLSKMNPHTLERPLSYEEERGKPMPSRNHGSVQAKLIIDFSKHSQFRIYGELTLQFEGELYTPDISIYPSEPIDLRHDEVRRTEPPAVAVEIFSPTQGYQEVMEKAEVYLRNGVKSVWLVSPPLRNITILAPDGRQESFHSGVAKDPATGLSADLASVFS